MADGSMGREFSAADVKRLQRTKSGLRYDKYRAKLIDRLQNDKEFAKKANAELHRQKTVTPGQVHTNAFMTNLSTMYKNDDFIGEQLMPVAPVPKYSDNLVTYDKRDRTAGPTDEMGSRSAANELSEERGTDSYSLKLYGLQNSLPASTVENQDPAFDEMLDLIEAINDVLALKREIRCATALTTAANFAGNTATLSGSDQWNSAAGGDPLKNLQDGLAACWSGTGPGDFYGYCSLDVWNVLARHPRLLDLFKYTAPGLTKMDAVAREIGLAKLLVGAARQDTANPGSSASYSRIWGKHFGIARVGRRPSIRNAVFGHTLRFKGHPITQQWFDPTKGITGSFMAKVGFAEQQKVLAGTTGYLFVNAIS